MKRFFFLLLIIGINTGVWAQTTKQTTNKLILKTEIDTISYELGMASSPADMLPDFLVRMGSDSACVAEYLKGFKESMNASNDAKSIAYEMGKQHGFTTKIQTLANVSQQIFGKGTENSISIDLFLQGFLDVIEGRTRLTIDGEVITQEMAQMELQQRIQSLMEKRDSVEYLPNRVAGENFLAEKAKEPNVKALEQGVLYKVIKTGAQGSKCPSLNNTIKIAYKGMTIDGEVFDESEGAEFPLNSLIEGWKIALPKMSVGSKWIIYLPHEVAYGSRGSLPYIKPYSTLIFEIELLSILP